MSTRGPGLAAAVTAVATLALSAVAWGAPPVRVGSKSFTESYILGEIVAQLVEQVNEARAERRLGLGGTGIVYGALASGDLDVYPEYTGTISRAILKDPSVTTVAALRERLRPLGLTISDPLGFDNTYALAVRRDTAARLGLRTISDLRRHPRLAAAFDPGFLEREDGWPGLRRHYGLELANVRLMEHALTYPALASGRVDVIDVFATDGQLARRDLVILADDRRFFPDYAAVLLARLSFTEQHPATWAELGRRLAGRIDTATMARLNALADLDGRSFREVAAQFLGRPPLEPARRWRSRELIRLTLEHLWLVGISVGVATALGIPLGILAARR
jgi:osmoprotectant transport system permease protein